MWTVLFSSCFSPFQLFIFRDENVVPKTPEHSITYPFDFETLSGNKISCVSCEDDICFSVANEMNLTRVN